MFHLANHSIIQQIFIELLLCDRDYSRYSKYMRDINTSDKNSCRHGAYYSKGEIINILACYILLLMVTNGIKKNKVAERDEGV